MQAGVPAEAFSFYPRDHAGGGEILRRTGRGMLFGDVGVGAPVSRATRASRCTARATARSSSARTRIDDWEQLHRHDRGVGGRQRRPLVRQRVRACGSLRHAERDRRGAGASGWPQIVPRAADDEQAPLAPFADPCVAERISAMIDADLEIAGRRRRHARSIAAPSRVGDGATAAPTCCRRSSSAIARSIRWPTASSCSRSSASWRCDRRRDARRLGHDAGRHRASPTTPTLLERLVASPHVDRLNLGPIPTNQIGWDQPHEGNLFEHLYARRAIPARRRDPRRSMRILSLTAGAGVDVLRQLPARQRAGGRAAAPAATTSR